MSKEFTQKTIAQWKRIAANVNADVVKRDKLVAKRAKLNAEIEELNQKIDLQEAPVKLVTNGFTTSDILKKVVEETGKTDKDGRPIKTTKYVLRYPETILPQAVEETVEDIIEAEEITREDLSDDTNV